MTRLKLHPKVSTLERKFELCWLAVAGEYGPQLVREYPFDPKRKWRFDFAQPGTRAAIELEGGHWSGGRHTRGTGFEADCEKYNAAAIQGWHVFRLTAKMVTTAWCECLVDWIEERTTAPQLDRGALHVPQETSNARRVIDGVRELVGQPSNAILAAKFYSGVFSLGWDAVRRRLITLEAP